MEIVVGFSVEKVNDMVWLSFYDAKGQGVVLPLSPEDARKIRDELWQILGP